MKKIFLSVFLAVLIPQMAQAGVEDNLAGLGMSAEMAKYVASIIPGGSVLANNAFLKARNAANSADISVLKVDANNNTWVNAITGKGILFTVDSSAEATLANDQLTLAGAAFQIVPGATSLSFRNNADNADNLIILDAGGATFRTTVTATGGFMYPAALAETVAAAGTAQGHGPLTAGKFIHNITASDETKVVTLPACAAANIGELHYLQNTVSNKFLKIFPATSGNINGAGANTAITTGAAGDGGGTTTCYCQAANVWNCG